MTKQTYRTPPELLRAVERRFGPITFDLAASDGDEVVPAHFSPEQDSLKQEWPRDGVMWLNPPFRKMLPWAQKCAAYDGSATILLLAPAAVDTSWWDACVRDCATTVLALVPRVSFVGTEQGINRTLALIVYEPAAPPTSEVHLWRWRDRSFSDEARAALVARNYKHGKRYTPEYICWFNLRQRCNNKNHHGYKNYGGRGISVCERWNLSFEAFLCDMGNRPSVEHEIDRINNDGNYEPANCRWATKSQNAANRRPRQRNEHGQYF